MATTKPCGCVAATRMVSVEWRGREHELAPLPTTWDITRYRFGVIVTAGNMVRLTEASAACASRERDVRLAFIGSIHGLLRVQFCRCLRLFAIVFLERSLCNCALFMKGLTLAHCSTLLRSTHWIRRAHARDVSCGSDPNIGRARQYCMGCASARRSALLCGSARFSVLSRLCYPSRVLSCLRA